MDYLIDLPLVSGLELYISDPEIVHAMPRGLCGTPYMSPVAA